MKGRLSDERGFTLVELAVVMIVITVLAAIAVTQLNSHKASAQDSEAKMITGSMHAQVESCFVEPEDYRGCETGDGTLESAGWREGDGVGEVEVRARGPRGYRISAQSRSGNRFRITKTDGGRPERSCTVGPDGKSGGCRDGGTW